MDPSTFVSSPKGRKASAQILGELSDLWIKLDPAVATILNVGIKWISKTAPFDKV